MILKKIFIYLTSFFLLAFAIANVSFADAADELKQNTEQLKAISRMAATGHALTRNDVVTSVNLAKARVKLFKQVFAKDQTLAESLALSPEVIKYLPEQTRPRIERRVRDFIAELEIRAADLVMDPDDALQYILKTKAGNFRLYSIDPLPNSFRTGTILKIVKGFRFPEERRYPAIVAGIKDILIVKRAFAPSTPNTFGQQKTIVMLVNFQNAPSSQPWTMDAVKQTVFGTVNDMFYEYSYHQTTIVGDVVGWYTLPLNSNTNCDSLVDQIPTLANRAASNAGVDVSKYLRRIYMFPKTQSCGWAGLGTVDGSRPTNAWLNGYNYNTITGHELGHNVGLSHSKFLKCTGSVNTGNCSRVEYGDITDNMGDGKAAHFNAFQKERLGWLNYQSSPPITTVTNSGDYVIDAFETYNTNSKALKILKRSGSSDYYYVEFRQPNGFDSTLACRGCDYTNGVVLHQGNTSSGNTSDLLDLSPTDSTTKVALMPGTSFKDPNAPNGGVTITLNSISGGKAQVNVSFGASVPGGCTRQNPTMTISPSSSQSVPPGGTANYTIALTNRDSSDCNPSTFSFTITQQDACLKATLSQKTLTLDPNASGKVNLAVTTSSIVEAGNYRVNVTGTNTASQSNSASVNALLTVE